MKRVLIIKSTVGILLISMLCACGTPKISETGDAGCGRGKMCVKMGYGDGPVQQLRFGRYSTGALRFSDTLSMASCFFGMRFTHKPAVGFKLFCGQGDTTDVFWRYGKVIDDIYDEQLMGQQMNNGEVMLGEVNSGLRRWNFYYNQSKLPHGETVGEICSEGMCIQLIRGKRPAELNFVFMGHIVGVLGMLPHRYVWIEQRLNVQVQQVLGSVSAGILMNELHG